MEKINLTEREFVGKILKGADKKLRGRYFVHIPELMPHLEESEGILVSNHSHNWRITNSDVGSYGQYFPLHPGTFVMVKFWKNDLNSGYIDRILSDYNDNTDLKPSVKCEKPKTVVEDRDEQYIIFKTPKKFNIFYINEESSEEPNTIYLIYNHMDFRRTVLRINEEGIHWWSNDNEYIRIAKNSHKKVDGNISIKSDGSIFINASGSIHIKADGDVNIDGATVNINCGKSQGGQDVPDLK